MRLSCHVQHRVISMCRVTPVSGSEAVVLRRLTNSSLEKSSSSKKINNNNNTGHQLNYTNVTIPSNY